MDFSQGVDNLTITFTGPGKTNIELSPGSDTFKLYQAPSGHLMLPCCEYEKTPDTQEETGLTLVASSGDSHAAIAASNDPLGTLAAQSSASSSSVHPALAELHAQDAAGDAQIAEDVAKDPFNWTKRYTSPLPSRGRSAGAEDRRTIKTFTYTQG